MDDKVSEPVEELNMYSKQLCSKNLKVDVLEQMQKNIVLTLCKLEHIFELTFFDIMIHLAIHLVTEAKLAGHKPFCWMYHFKRDI